jgi:hypothetical protein
MEIEKNPTTVFKTVSSQVKKEVSKKEVDMKLSDNSDWGEEPQLENQTAIPTLDASDLDWLDESETNNEAVETSSDAEVSSDIEVVESSTVQDEQEKEIVSANDDIEINFLVSSSDETSDDECSEPEINFIGSIEDEDEEELVLPVSFSFTLNTYRGIVRIGTGEKISFKESKDALADQLARIASLTPELFSGVIERYPNVEFSERVRYSMSTYFYGLTRSHTDRKNRLLIESGLIVLEHIMNGLLTEDHISTYTSVIDMERKSMQEGTTRDQPKPKIQKKCRK